MSDETIVYRTVHGVELITLAPENVEWARPTKGDSVETPKKVARVSRSRDDDQGARREHPL